MELVDTKPLLVRLTSTCRAALEGSLRLCVQARHYEVTLEHMVLSLLDDGSSDIAFLVSHYEVNPAELRAAFQRGLEEQRTGNAGRPVLSFVMLEWIQDAWTMGSIEYGFQTIRSGALFARLVRYPMKYSTCGIGPLIENISKDDLKANLPQIVSGSNEEPLSSGDAAGAGGASPHSSQSEVFRIRRK